MYSSGELAELCSHCVCSRSSSTDDWNRLWFLRCSLVSIAAHILDTMTVDLYHAMHIPWNYLCPLPKIGVPYFYRGSFPR